MLKPRPTYTTNVQRGVHKESSNCKKLPDYFQYYASYYIEKITTVLCKMHDTSDKFKEGNGILIIQDCLKKVTTMLDKLPQLVYAVTKFDMYVQLLNIPDVEDTADLITKNSDKHGILRMQSDISIKLPDRLKMLQNYFRESSKL